LTSCGQTTPIPTVADSSSTVKGLGGRTLIIANDVDYPPFEFLKDGKFVGFDIDLVNAIAKEANFTVVARQMDFNGIILALQAHQVDMAIAAITIRPDREKVVDFSIPYFRTGLSLAVRSDRNDITKPEDLKGKKVAVKIGTTGETFIRNLSYANEISIKTFDNDTDTYLAVINGNVDAVIHDDAALRFYVASEKTSTLKIVGGLLTGDSYGIAVPSGQADILKAVNDALRTLAKNGTYDQIYQKWFGSNPTQRPGDF
jgi:glutamine transport system substrate-binding protein